MPRAPAFYACKTLLWSEPDRNRRIIYAYDTDTVVRVLNAEMRPWTPEMQRDLEAELLSLNEMAETRTTIVRVMRKARHALATR